MTPFSRRALGAIEVALVFAAYRLFPRIAVGVAAWLGFTLPSMPLLRHTYLAFLMVAALMAWLYRQGEPLARFGLVRPRWRDLGLGLVLAIALIAFEAAVRSLTYPLIAAWTGANPHLAERTFAAIKGDLPLFLMIVPCVWLFAAVGEEFLFRGYLLTRFRQVLGGGRAALAIAIVLQATAFALAHWYQGPFGMVPIGFGAVLSGIATVAWGRNLWPAIIAHGLIDTLGFTLLFMGRPLT